MLFIEILLSIHCLLWVSSWIIGTRWLTNQPSFKLKLARFLLVSCIVSPLIVQCINTTQKMERFNYVSFDAVQEYAKQPILKTEPLSIIRESASAFATSNINYLQLF